MWGYRPVRPLCLQAAQIVQWVDAQCPALSLRHQQGWDSKRWNSNSNSNKPEPDSKAGSVNELHKAVREGLGRLAGSTHVERVELTDGFPTMFSNIREVWRYFKGQAATQFIRRFIETDFDESEFLEGCRDACYMVNHLISEQAYKELASMVSPLCLSAFKRTQEDYISQGLHFTIAPSEEIEANIHAISLVHGDDLDKYFKVPESSLSQPDGESAASDCTTSQSSSAGPQSANASGESSSRSNYGPLPSGFWDDYPEEVADLNVPPSSRWLQVGVGIKTALDIKTANKSGQVVQHLIDHRSQIWKFARRLPSKVPKKQLAAPWQLMAVG